MRSDVRQCVVLVLQRSRPTVSLYPAFQRPSRAKFAAVRAGFQSHGIRSIHPLSRHMTTSNHDHEDFFRYTSGRWLWDEEQQLRDRYKFFNVAELQKVAAQAIGSSKCVSMTKLAEGNYNKVFRLTMDDGKTVLARIPNPNAGPPFYTTASEVATMEFAREILEIPIPRVFKWSSTSQNPVESEYIILEEAAGTQLATLWDDLSPGVKLSVMRQLVTIEQKMASWSFSHYGSIYFASDAVPDAVAANITNDSTRELKEKVSKTYTIGPSVDRGFWNKERSTMKISQGPWPSPQDYATSMGRRETEWINNYANMKPPIKAALISKAQNCPQAHLELLEKLLKVVPYLMDIETRLTRSTLWHTDLHSANVFVNEGYITAIVDWQSSWAGPLFLQAQPPPLVDYQGEILLKRPDNFETLTTDQQAEIKQKIFKSTLFQLYLVETKKQNPALAEVFHIDHGKTRRLPIELAGNTWDDDIVPFREALINVEKNWKELGIQAACPFHFSQDELASHAQDAEGWNEVQDFFDSIQDLVKRDGWTHLETFDIALEFFSDLRQGGLANLKGKEREIFEKQTLWADKRH